MNESIIYSVLSIIYVLEIVEKLKTWIPAFAGMTVPCTYICHSSEGWNPEYLMEI